jgi:hypothetical protein
MSVRVAVAAEEGPRELREAAEIVVGDPLEFVSLLRRL